MVISTLAKANILQSDTLAGRLLRWLLQPARIPLLFSVTVMSAIMYHYAPSLTPLWIVLSLILQAGLFRLFDFVQKHPILGSALYTAAGFVFLGISLTMLRMGHSDAIFAPAGTENQLPFWVWFMTPQSILPAEYVGYTIAMYLMFTYFIASIAYYFTFVRYRVLMSFIVMLFPFVIYAKENETMPIPAIIILLVCYFAVMIYCRQAHAEHSDVVQRYQPDLQSHLSAPSKKSPYAKVKPEILDGRFLQATGLFLAAASILILVIPKPEVQADRTTLEAMVNLSSLSSFLEKAISGFADSSDGGNYAQQSYPRPLYYCAADEALNLRVRTFTTYDYIKDTWNASADDKMQSPDIYNYNEVIPAFKTLCHDQAPITLIHLIRNGAENSPEFKEKWGLEPLLATEPTPEADVHMGLNVAAAGANKDLVSPTPLHITTSWAAMVNTLYQNKTGIVFRPEDTGYSLMFMESEYYSDTYILSDEAQAAMRVCSTETWDDFLVDLYSALPAGNSQRKLVMESIVNAGSSVRCRNANSNDIPDEIRDLAADITAGKTSDYDKVTAIRDYLRSGIYTYSLSAPRPANVTAFLFKDKAGVCYQFATAMVQLCRAAGLSARYVEGYQISQPNTNTFNNLGQYNYVITTNHAHAFCDVFIAGYGWVMVDATAAQTNTSQKNSAVLSTLQIAGLILFAVGLIIILAVMWLVPMIGEKRFRARFRKQRSAACIQEAFARLRKQWKADPAKTARILCEEQSAFLQLDLSDLLNGFEETVYADRCAPETADRVYRVYCAARSAYRPAVKRQRKEKRAQAAANKKAAKEPA